METKYEKTLKFKFSAVTTFVLGQQIYLNGLAFLEGKYGSAAWSNQEHALNVINSVYTAAVGYGQHLWRLFCDVAAGGVGVR